MLVWLTIGDAPAVWDEHWEEMARPILRRRPRDAAHDELLAVVVGSTPIPRSEITKKLWDYIKSKGLQNPEKKTEIVADDALKAVFGGKERVTMFEMTKLVSQHIQG